MIIIHNPKKKKKLRERLNVGTRPDRQFKIFGKKKDLTVILIVLY